MIENPPLKQLSSVAIWWRWMLSIVIGFAIGSVFAVPATFVGLHFVGTGSIALGLCEAGSGNLGCILRSGILMAAIVIALPISVLQRLLMRRLIRRSWWWVLVSSLGWVMVAITLSEVAYIPISGAIKLADGRIVEVNLLQNLGEVVQGVGGAILAGIILSGLQWLLMSEDMPHSAWWIGLHGGLMLIGAVAILLILRGTGGLMGLWLFFAVFMMLYGAISGATLAKLANTNR
jgi:hypothetical protein